MTVLSVKRAVKNWAITGSTGSVSFIINTDNPDDEFPTVKVESHRIGLPREFEVHPDNANYKVGEGGVSISRISRGKLEDPDSPAVWHAVITYERLGSNFNSSSQPGLNRLLSYSTDTKTYTRTAVSAYERLLPDGSTYQPTRGDTPSKTKNIKIVNSAVDPFEAASIQEEYFHPILVFTQRESNNFDNVAAVKFMGSINQNTTTILGTEIPPGKAMMRTVRPFLAVNEDDKQEWRCTYEVELVEDMTKAKNKMDDDDFWLKILDTGLQAFFYVPEKYKRAILQSDLQNTNIKAGSKRDAAIREPALLDGLGSISETSEPQGIFYKYRTRPFKDWEVGLNLIKSSIKFR